MVSFPNLAGCKRRDITMRVVISMLQQEQKCHCGGRYKWAGYRQDGFHFGAVGRFGSDNGSGSVVVGVVVVGGVVVVVVVGGGGVVAEWVVDWVVVEWVLRVRVAVWVVVVLQRNRVPIAPSWHATVVAQISTLQCVCE